MTDLICRHALVATLRKERDAYFRDHFAQDPATGTYEASNAKEEYLAELDERIEMVEGFPTFEIGPIATVVNNNQPGWINLIETAPHVTLDVGTKLYAAPVSQNPASNDEEKRDMLAIASDYEAGLNKALRSGYEEFGPTWERRQRLIIKALRAVVGNAGRGS